MFKGGSGTKSRKCLHPLLPFQWHNFLLQFLVNNFAGLSFWGEWSLSSTITHLHVSLVDSTGHHIQGVIFSKITHLISLRGAVYSLPHISISKGLSCLPLQVVFHTIWCGIFYLRETQRYGISANRLRLRQSKYWTCNLNHPSPKLYLFHGFIASSQGQGIEWIQKH
jgi:hypothetical protein